MRLAHCADIHIRSLSRHAEYKEVFRSFVDDCRQQAVDHIFVGGDIFHTKTTGITGEYIDLFRWWLTEMAAIAEVHMILGNHDGNLTNLSRQDSVTPIVEAMSNPRIHLYKKSGTYEFAPGFTFCVFSLFDEDGWSSVSPQAGAVNIACYHGPVLGSTTESEWAVEDGLTVDFFDAYPFTLLGDIHKRQDLKRRCGKPVMSYPGTLIQQNYAEDLEHGYLLWDIREEDDWDVEFRPMPNDHPYLTVDWQGSLDKTMTLLAGMQPGSRFRIRSQVQLTQDDVHLLSENLKTTLSAAEVTFKSDFEIDKKLVQAGTSTVTKTDLRSPDIIVKLLKDFHKETLTDKDVAAVTDKVKDYLSQVASSDDTSRGSSWSIRNIGWDNLFSYGEGNSLNFDKLSGIVGIFGPNRTGKSSIVGALMYSLFNTTDRGPMKNINICNVRKAYCSSQVVLEHNGVPYVIERQTTKSTNRKGVVTAATNLNLIRVEEDGTTIDMCGEQRSDTEKTIRSLLGTAEDFLMTSLSAQGETNQFISQGSTKRRSLLSRFLDLDVFDRLYDLAAKDSAAIKAQLRNFPDRDWDDLAAKHTLSLSRLDAAITMADDRSSSAQMSLALLRQELAKHNASPITTHDVDAQRRKVTNLQNQVDTCSSAMEEIAASQADLASKEETLSKLVEAADVKDLKARLESQRKLEAAIVELRHDHDTQTRQLVHQQRSLKILDEVPCGDSFPSCKFIKDAHANKKSMAAQDKRAANALKALEEAKAALASVSEPGLAEKIAKHEKAVDLLSKVKLEALRKEAELERTRSSCESYRTSLEEESARLVHLEEALNNHENVEVVSIRSQIKDLLEVVRNCDTDKLTAASARGKLASDIEKLASERKSRHALLQDVRIQELVSMAFSKKGIPLLIIKSQLPLINAEISKILQGIADFTIELENDEETDSLEIYIDYGDSRRVVELCSGMEKTIAAIALRVAMVNVSSLPKPNFFIIDEGFGTLDSAGVEACNRLLASLKRYFKTVIVITHVDGIKDAADHVLEITKVEKDSRLECP